MITFVGNERLMHMTPPNHVPCQYNLIQFNTNEYNSIQFIIIHYQLIQISTIQHYLIQFNTIEYNWIQFEYISDPGFYAGYVRTWLQQHTNWKKARIYSA